jgi:hypothetical protein
MGRSGSVASSPHFKGEMWGTHKMRIPRQKGAGGWGGWDDSGSFALERRAQDDNHKTNAGIPIQVVGKKREKVVPERPGVWELRGRMVPLWLRTISSETQRPRPVPVVGLVV